MNKSTFTKRKAMIWLASGAAVLGLSVGITNIASAADQPDTKAAVETPLEGDIADQVTAAALEAAPGATVDRVETDDTYAYEAHITLEDGTHKVLFFDENFEFQGEETLPAHGGPGGCDHPDEMPAESTTTTIS